MQPDEPPSWSRATRTLLRDIADLELWQPATSLALAGYAVVPDVLAESEVLSLRRRAMELNDRLATAGLSIDDRAGDLLDLGPALRRFVGDERVNTLLRVVLGDGFALSSIRVSSIRPGAPTAQGPLGDPLALPWLGGQALSASATCCLNDWRAERGTVQLIPGSHLVPPRLACEQSDVVSVECPAGSVLVVNGNTWRRSGPYGGGGTLPSLGLVAVHCCSFVSPRASYPAIAPS